MNKPLFNFENSDNKIYYTDSYTKLPTKSKYFSAPKELNMLYALASGDFSQLYQYDLDTIYGIDIDLTKLTTSYVFEHIPVIDDNHNITVKKSSTDTNGLELPIKTSDRFYIYVVTNFNKSTSSTLFYIFKDFSTVFIISYDKDTGTLSYDSTSSYDYWRSNNYNRLLSDPTVNNLVYKEDIIDYEYNQIKVGDDLSNTQIYLYDEDGNLNKVLHDMAVSQSNITTLFKSTDGACIYIKKTSSTLIKILYTLKGSNTLEDLCSIHLVGDGYTLGNIIYPGDFIVKSLENVTSEDIKGIHKYFCLRSNAKDTGWITCTTSSSNGVGTFNHSNAGGELQVRKVGKVVYLNLTLNLNLDENTASNNHYLFILDKKYRPTQTIYFTSLLTYDLDSRSDSASSCVVSISPDGKVELLNYKEVARQQIEIGGNTLKLNHLVSYPV